MRSQTGSRTRVSWLTALGLPHSSGASRIVVLRHEHHQTPWKVVGLGWGPRILISKKFPGDADADAAGPRTAAENHREKPGGRRTVRN